MTDAQRPDTGTDHCTGGSERHEISARATVYHYAQYDSPEDIPEDDKAFPLSDFDQTHTAHIGYECTCGDNFIFARTAAEHLRSLDTDTDPIDESNGDDTDE